jgi:positive regulator of sigma E activity
MSNDPTKAAGRWDIGKSNLLYNLVYLLVALTVSYLFNLTFLAAVLWCLPLIPAWWLVKKKLRREDEHN